MQWAINDAKVFVATGGREFDGTLPVVVLLHGAGLDHTVWALLARWFAHRGCGVLAPDLPGHGRSSGEPLDSIEAMADWTAALIARSGAPSVRIIGHSMGSLIALETAARHSRSVAALGLINTAARMPVSPDLLGAAQANDHRAVEMVSFWGHGFWAAIGGSRSPGTWMLGAGTRLLERAPPGVLFRDLAACNAYQGGLAAAALITAPVTIVLGQRDLMTPAQAGMQLARAFSKARLVTVAGAGHMLMSERPDEVLDAVRDLLNP